MNLPIHSRSDSGVTVEQQQFNFELFIPSLVRSDSGLTTARLRSGPLPEEHHKAIDHINIIVQVMQTQSYNL